MDTKLEDNSLFVMSNACVSRDSSRVSIESSKCFRSIGLQNDKPKTIMNWASMQRAYEIEACKMIKYPVGQSSRGFDMAL